METQANDGAFAGSGGRQGDYVCPPSKGVTKREYFAAQFYAVRIAGMGSSQINLPIIADRAVEDADILIKALNKNK